jgi:hypothetical protein
MFRRLHVLSLRSVAAAVVALAAVGTVLAGCSGQTGVAPRPESPSPVLDRAARAALNSKLSAGLQCEERLEVFAESSFIDPTRGTDCVRPDKRAIFVRVFAHSATVPKFLQEWAPTIGEGRWFVHGANWVVIGPRDALGAAAEVSGATRPSKDAPTHVVVPARDADQDTCMSVVASAAADLVLAPERFADDRRSLNADVPGAVAVIERRVTPQVVATLKGKLDYQISSSLSRFGDDFRTVCLRSFS